MGAEYKVHTKLLTEFETLGVMGENNSGIIIMNNHFLYTVYLLFAFAMQYSDQVNNKY